MKWKKKSHEYFLRGGKGYAKNPFLSGVIYCTKGRGSVLISECERYIIFTGSRSQNKNISNKQLCLDVNKLIKSKPFYDYYIGLIVDLPHNLRLEELNKVEDALIHSDEFKEGFLGLEPEIDFINKATDKIKGIGGSMSIRGKSFVLTGRMSKTRSELTSIIEIRGGFVQDKVKSSTDYLVCTQTSIDNQTKKWSESKKNGVTIILESDLIHMFRDETYSIQSKPIKQNKELSLDELLDINERLDSEINDL